MAVQSLNVCFEAPDTFATRFGALAKSLLMHKPEVVCLQEATPELVSVFQSCKVFQLYTMSPPPTSGGGGNDDYGYCTLILARKELQASFLRIPFTRTNMKRDLLVATFRGAGWEEDLAVGTMHLESLNSHPIREAQMRQAKQELSKYDNAILVGDFNFCSYRNYDKWSTARLQNDSLQTCLPGFVDQWPRLHGSPGYTFEDRRNQWKFTDKLLADSQYRFDRVLAKLGTMEVVSMELVHQDIIGRVGGPMPCELFVSDHIGLQVQVEARSIKKARIQDDEVIFLEKGKEKPSETEEVWIRLANGAKTAQRGFDPEATVGGALRPWARSLDPGLKDFDLVEMPSGKRLEAGDLVGRLHRCTLRVVDK
ncbi:hypothetical protein BASA81_012566 [Batrachochytrium salamandrivorans]|nr:hypothetical protein BASA81_012566 [Batrachochytrium salamandrivorans]